MPLMHANGHTRIITPEPTPEVVAPPASPPAWFNVALVSVAVFAGPAAGLVLAAYVGLLYRVLRLAAGL